MWLGLFVQAFSAIEVLNSNAEPAVHPPVQEGQPVEDENNPWAHCMVMWGNLLYEASQMYAAAGRADWKATLDQAVDNFRAAGCPENDIRAALGNHTQVEHLDLPPIKVGAAPPLMPHLQTAPVSCGPNTPNQSFDLVEGLHLVVGHIPVSQSMCRRWLSEAFCGGPLSTQILFYGSNPCRYAH